MKTFREKAVEAVLGGALEIVVRVLRIVPLSILQWGGRRLGELFFYLDTRMKRVTLVNLKLCFPEQGEAEIRTLALRSLQSTGQVVAEAGLVLGKINSATERCIKTVEGDALLRGRNGAGVLLLVPHFGNWELINYYVSSRHNLLALYDPPKLKSLDSALLKLRKKSGGELYPANPAGLRQMFKALKRGKIVGLLPDQVPERTAGVYVPFFGVPALTMTLVSRLIHQTGARVVFGYALRLPNSQGFQICFSAATDTLYKADSLGCLQAINAHIEEIVSQATDQYQWEYKRFKRGPDKAVDRYR